MLGCLIVTQGAALGQAKGPPRELGLLEAVKLALSRNATIQVGVTQVDSARGRLQEASGQFDMSVATKVGSERNYSLLTNSQLSQFPPFFPNTPAANIGDTASASAGFSKQFRSGFVVEPSVSVVRTADNISRLTADALALNRPIYAVKVTIPLLKNAGRDVVGAAESIAISEVDATRLDLTQSVSQTVSNVTMAYWNFLSAERVRAIALDAEVSSERRARDVDRLIQADRLPVSERDLLLADIASKRSNRISAEQAYIDARSNLGRAIGLSAEETAVLLPADTAYPSVTPDAREVDERLSELRRTALEFRRDLAASALRREQARIAVDATQKNLKPQLNLALSVGMSGLREGDGNNDFMRSLSSRLRGPNTSVSLSYLFPPENNVAGGQLAQRIAILNQTRVVEEDLRYAVLTSVETAASAVRRLALQLDEARRAEELYRRAVTNEETRRQLGRGTLLDVINVADRLLSARFATNAAQLNYALAVIQLRFATGTLAPGTGTSPREYLIDIDAITTVPR